jgi:pimeloyl-ACP methyl ester carboxylesterase
MRGGTAARGCGDYEHTDDERTQGPPTYASDNTEWTRDEEHLMSDITDFEQQQIDTANASGKKPVVFVHGLWLLPSSWDRWRAHFEDAGYTTLAPAWPDDPNTVAEANANPDVMAKKTVGEVADHFEDVIGKLASKPVLLGHSFGGLITEILAGRGGAAASVAISPAPFRGVLPLPISSLKSAFPVLGNPANHSRAVPLTFEQFQYGFANALTEDEAKELYNTFAVPAPGAPLFQAATANLNPWTEAKVNTKNADRGPMLIIAGEKDHTVPIAISKASYKKEKKNDSPTDMTVIPGRGHSLTIDSGWQEVADTALAFVQKYVAP